MNALAIRIATQPDVDLGRALYRLNDLSDADIVRVMYAKHREQTGSVDELALHMQRITAISALYRDNDTIKVWSLGDESSSEHDLIAHFFSGIEKYTPTLVSWNGSRYDLPIIQYRALKHGIVSRTYWDTGEHDKAFRDANYHDRFHSRHVDLMDTLSGHQQPGLASLDEIALMLNLPRLNEDESTDSSDPAAVRQSCESEVLNLWQIYLSWLHLTSELDEASLADERAVLHESLLQENQPHLAAYLTAWNDISG
jgi:predicted PolB exonuclease-like 3'-5' exonuclease